MKVQIMKHDPELIMPEFKDESDWIDLRAAKDIWINEGEFALVPLGISVRLPDGYEANITPRSSTFKKYGVIQTNHFAIIDNSYCGSNDIWHWPIYCLIGKDNHITDGLEIRGTQIHKNDRICQFRINKIQPKFEIEKVDSLSDQDRGGFGSTGVK